MARALIDEKRSAEAIVALEKWNAQEPDQAIDELWSAYVHVGRYDDARALSDQLASVPGDQPLFFSTAMKMIGDMYDGQTASALEVMGTGKKELGADTSWRDVASMLELLCATASGRWELGLQLADAYDERFPDGDEVQAVQTLRTINYAGAKQFENAEQALKKLVDEAQEGDKIVGLIYGGRIDFERGDYDAAIEKYEAAVEDLPENINQSIWYADTWYYLARSYWELGRYDDAATYFRKMVHAENERTVTPIEWVRSLDYMARYYDRRGDEREAREMWQRYLDRWQDGDIDRERVAEVAALLKN